MRALGDDAPVIHHDDPVRLEHRRQAMRDDQRGAAFHQPLQRLLDGAFALRVER